MNKIIVYLVFCVCLVASVLAACPGTMVGAGTAGNPCNISTCYDLQNMTNGLTASYQLVNNIDCSNTTTWNGGIGFKPIGNYEVTSFSGNFEGNKKTISNLYIKHLTGYGASLFGSIEGDIKIQNFKLYNATVIGAGYMSSVAGIVGMTAPVNANFENISCLDCFLNNTDVILGGLFAGIIAGNINISSCNFIGRLHSELDTGGIFEETDTNANVIVKNCYTIINYTSPKNGVSGTFAGISNSAYFNTIILNSYSMYNFNSSLTATGTYKFSGIGNIKINVQDSFTISNTTNTQQVYATYHGVQTYFIKNFYYYNISNNINCTDSGNTNCTAINDKTYFYSKSNAPLSSWDFTNVWQENAGSYPTLRWESNGPACTANVTNTSWTSWLNISCVGNYMNQTRNLTQYDTYVCASNITFVEQRATQACVFRYDTIMMPAFTEMANLFSLLIVVAIMSIIIVIIAAMFGYGVPNIDMYKMVLIIVISAMLLAIGIVVISQLGI